MEIKDASKLVCVHLTDMKQLSMEHMLCNLTEIIRCSYQEFRGVPWVHLHLVVQGLQAFPVDPVDQEMKSLYLPGILDVLDFHPDLLDPVDLQVPGHPRLH